MHKKLLLVEDSVTIQKVFELAFEKTNISVIAAGNGDDAVRMLGKMSPDLVIVDVTLPGKDGFEVAAMLAAEESMKEKPILLLASSLAAVNDKKLKACGAKGVLIKPFEVSELMKKVGEFLEKEDELPAKASPADSPVPDDDRWDFSDVLDEMEKKAPDAKPEAVVRPAAAEILQLSEKIDDVGLDEFDVSADDIEKPASSSASEELFTMEEAALANADIIEEVEEFEEIGELEEGGSPVLMAKASDDDDMFEDLYAPLPLNIPLESDESVLEEILEKVPFEIPEETPAQTVAESPVVVPKDVLGKTSFEIPKETSAQTVAESPMVAPEDIIEETPFEIPEEAFAQTVAESPMVAPEDIIEETPFEMPEEAFAQTAAGSPMVVPEDIIEKTLVEIPEETFAETDTRTPVAVPEDALMVELKKQFASRADAIFREVMEKAVEKAMSEMAERLTAEFSAKMRESVELIAWEVIPATAEALIREEIARIRALAAKSTTS